MTVETPGAWPRPNPRGPAPLDVGLALADAERACRENGARMLTLTRTTDGWIASAIFVTGRRFRNGVRCGPGRLDAVAAELADLVRAAVSESEDRVMDGNR